jgi:hypothetical protein
MTSGGALDWLILRHALRGMLQRKVVRTLQIGLILLQPVWIFLKKKEKEKMKKKSMSYPHHRMRTRHLQKRPKESWNTAGPFRWGWKDYPWRFLVFLEATERIKKITAYNQPYFSPEPWDLTLIFCAAYFWRLSTPIVSLEKKKKQNKIWSTACSFRGAITIVSHKHQQVKRRWSGWWRIYEIGELTVASNPKKNDERRKKK